MKHAILYLAAGVGFAIRRETCGGVFAQELATSSILSNRNVILPKTVVDNKLRLFFYVGLEGAGHHYIDSVFESMYDGSNGLPQVPDWGFNMHEYFLPTSMTDSPENYAQSYDRSKTIMRSLAERAKSVASPGAIFKPPGRYSYPCNPGPDKAVQYIDVRKMAEAAEAEGVDFRILYMRRSAKDLLLANTVHRRIHLMGLHDGEDRPQGDPLMHYMKVLFTDIAVMHALLAELDPAFVVCHDFDLLGNGVQASKIANFVSPNVDVARFLAASLVDDASPHLKSNETLPYRGGEVVAQRFQRAFDAFESTYC